MVFAGHWKTRERETGWEREQERQAWQQKLAACMDRTACRDLVHKHLQGWLGAANYNITTLYSKDISLQKEVGCFNHRVVTLVADKLEVTVVVRARFALVLKTNCIRQPKKNCPAHLTTTIHLCFHCLVTSSLLQLWSAFVMTPSQMFWGLSVYCVCKMNWAAA